MILTRISRSASGKLYSSCCLARIAPRSPPVSSLTDIVTNVGRGRRYKKPSRVDDRRVDVCSTDPGLHPGAYAHYLCVYICYRLHVHDINACRPRPQSPKFEAAETVLRPHRRKRRHLTSMPTCRTAGYQSASSCSILCNAFCLHLSHFSCSSLYLAFNCLITARTS